MNHHQKPHENKNDSEAQPICRCRWTTTEPTFGADQTFRTFPPPGSKNKMGDVLGEISARAVVTTRFGQTRPPTVYFVRVTLNRDKIDKKYISRRRRREK